MKSKFMVGQKVKVMEKIAHKGGSPSFVEGMEKYRGKVVTIKASFYFKGGPRYYLKEVGYSWHEDWLESLKKWDNTRKLIL